MAEAEEDYTDHKQEIKYIITRELTEHKRDLEQIKSFIQAKFYKPDKQLSAIDDAYIERKYLKYCVKFWLEETKHFLKTQTESQSRNVIQEILNTLDKIQHLSQIPDAFQRLEFHSLLMQHQTLVDEKSAISRFRNVCLEQIMDIDDTAEIELVFLETFVTYLSSSVNLQSIITELKLSDLCCGKLKFAEFLEAITGLDVNAYGEGLATLQEYAKCLQQGGELISIEKFKEVIGTYIQPVEIQKVSIDGRLVIEVIGRNVTVSKILSALENNVSEDSNIEEVRFIGGDIVHIDANLENEVWHGRNIAIFTKTIKIHNKVTWNVSGKDSSYIYSKNAGTGEDGHGQQGNDGYAGESGGNILILVEKVENPEHFTIISNGGNGSEGQDGGKGKDGVDGKGITKAEFEEKFPPVAKHFPPHIKPLILKTVKNIINDSQDIETQWYEKVTGMFSTQTYNENIYKLIEESRASGHIFIKSTTSQGNEITFSYSRFLFPKAFLLYRGSKGTPGCPGGAYGLGGQGGYPGEVTVQILESSQDLHILSRQGEQGKNGQGGLYGKHGKNGGDMGYMDYEVSTLLTGLWPKHFSTDHDSILSLVFYENSASDRLWCPYKKQYCIIRAVRNYDQKKDKYEQRQSTRQTDNNSQAVRKIDISSASILEKYSHHFNSLEVLAEKQRDIMVEADNEYTDDKQEIKDIIKREIAEHKRDLEQIKSCIQAQFYKPDKQLSAIDDAYITRKYLKYCVEFWLEETKKILKSHTESQSRNVIQEILNTLDKIQHLSQIPDAFQRLEFYSLLMQHQTLVDEKSAISRFRNVCLEQIVAINDSTVKEFIFLQTFVTYLSSSENLQSIITELKLGDLCCGELEFAKFLELINDLDVNAYGAGLATLQEYAKCLQQEDELILIEKFKEVIGTYIKPVVIQKVTIDGRLVIEVIGRNVAVSKILSALKNKFSEDSNIEEVRFIGGDIVHIDANLESEVWHGRNIAILTKSIKIQNKITWNVSGKDNTQIYSNNAGTGEDGHGQQGQDGYPGESGGNILILAKKIENLEYITIISNGGNGSKGQDGGKGKDGVEGKGIRKAEFDEKFPPVAYWTGQKRSSLADRTINNIFNDSQCITTEWFSKSTGTGYIDVSGDVFIKSTTSQGNEITFSYSFLGFQAFLLYKGSKGKPGCPGGEYGLGGQGGYPGEVTVQILESSQNLNIVTSTKQGEQGENGQGGLYGNHGKNGWDMGYMDLAFSAFSTESWPKLFGTDHDSILKLTRHENSASDRIKCYYDNKYYKITTSRIDQPKKSTYEERKSTRQNSHRQHHSQTVRKKGISSASISETYSNHLNSMDCTLQNLRSEIESTQQHVSQAIANQEQQEMQSMELERKRNINFFGLSKSDRIQNTLNLTSDAMNETLKVKELIEELSNEQQLSDNWKALSYVELSISQVCQIFDVFKKIIDKKNDSQDDTEKSKLSDMETLLNGKYQLASLQEIAKKIPAYQQATDDVKLSAESVARYLVEAKEKDNNISHHDLGTLNQYFYQNSDAQRAKIVQFYEDELQKPIKEALKRSIAAFVLEVDESDEVYTTIKRYHDEYEQFLKEKELKLNEYFATFRCELSHPRYADVYKLWVESTEDKSSSEFEKKIQTADPLKILYHQYKNQLQLEYDWEKCCKDQDILKKYYDYIREKGAISVSYRELLAYVFEINIRLYAEDEYCRLFLFGTHNSSSKQAVHLLYRNNDFFQLSFDENYFKLEKKRKIEDDLYGKILKDMKTLDQKKDIDDYVENKAFSDDNHLSDEQPHFDEEIDINQIIEFFPDEEKKQLKTWLGKNTLKYFGQPGILHYLLMRFSCEGRHISAQELRCLINSILNFCIEDRKEQNTFCWIIAAHSQRNWIDELILFQLENHFKQQLKEKSKWRNYLSKIKNKDFLLLFTVKLNKGGLISIQCIEDTLRLLSNITNGTVNLEGLEISEWPYVLKEKYWLCKLSSLANWPDNDKLPTAVYYLLSIENYSGTDLVEEMLKVLEEKKLELCPYYLTLIITNVHKGKWNIGKKELNLLENCSIKNWVRKMKQKFADTKEREIMQLVEFIEGNANTSAGILKSLKRIKPHLSMVFDHVPSKNGIVTFLKSTNKVTKPYIERVMFAAINRAIELKRGFQLRDTQKLTVLALLSNDRNTLAQVSTGEGKSLIVVAAAIMKALFGEKVHIMTSSSVLAKRDAEENRDIFNLFDIKVSHNCSEVIEERKKAYSDSQVVYGELSNFQRDYLLDKFYGKNILGDHDFKNVIVDEVDSMLLDRGNNMLYLSHDIADLDKLESVYIFIWQWINQPALEKEEIVHAFNIKTIEEAVLVDLYGLVKKEDIGRLGPELTELQKNYIWKVLVEANIIDNHGKLLIENSDDIKLNEILSPELSSYQNPLNFLLVECIERDKIIHVPNHLRSFAEKHLESWIKSAITAFFMKPGQDYVVDVDRTGTSPDRNPNIVILDRDTGTDQANSQWDEALHQFLQLKHGCKVSLQSLKAVFISNVSFFKLYSKLFGLTGTLGSQRERDLLRELHEVDFVTIPTANSKRFEEYFPIICSGKDEWIKRIHVEVKKLTEEKKRSVLIICETVNEVEVLYKTFGGKALGKVHMYTRDYEVFDIAQGTKQMDQGQIVIATNLAGRGTDIKPSDGLRKAGGLHVCLTYLPANLRIQEQAFGRAARSGDRGSGQLIIIDSKGHGYSNSRMLNLKKERDSEELYRISEIKTYYETQITVEERCFEAFKQQYERLKKEFDDVSVPSKVKEILLQSCLDKWAFWLDENSKYIRDFKDEKSKNQFNEKLSKLMENFKNLRTSAMLLGYNHKSWLAWVEENPVQMVKLGKYFSQNGNHDHAIQLFDKVIQKEPHFSAAAHYYKAFALTKTRAWKQGNKQTRKEFKENLQKAAELIDAQSEAAMYAAGIISNLRKNNPGSILQIDSFEKQQKSIINHYNIFVRSIDDIFGRAIDQQSFFNYEVSEELSDAIYRDILEKTFLKKLRVKKNIPEEAVKQICSVYGISVEKLHDFLSKYQGKAIQEKLFLRSLKNEIQLSGREAFWDLLIQEKVLNEEVKYVVVDIEKLTKIDPSVIGCLTELERKTFTLTNEQILLHAQYNVEQKTNDNIFEKAGFIKTVGKEKYKALKEKGVFSFNRKARLDLNQSKSITFPAYDSIALEDFTKVKITKNEAEKLLAELVANNVVEKKDNSENSAYRLIIKFDEIEQFSSSVYENNIKGLFSICFAYRIALQRMEKQRHEKNRPIRLQSKPHRILFWKLLEKKIIKPPVVTVDNEDLEKELNSMYSEPMTKEGIKQMLSKDKLIPEECTEKLFHCLVEKKWIREYNPIRDSKNTIVKFAVEESQNVYSEINIELAAMVLGGIVGGPFYSINSSNKRQTPLNFSPEGTKSQRIDETVSKILDNRLMLTNEDSLRNMACTLQQSKSLLKYLKAPDGKLKSLIELCGENNFSNIEEIHVFSLNGFDQLLQFDEMKWTRSMVLNTLTVVSLGLCQITVGAIIELKSAGILSGHVGAAFVNEGVNDIFFAASALKSGYFSWKDYRRQKLESLCFTAASAGLGIYFSRGQKLSRFGYKLAGPNFNFGVTSVAKMSGTGTKVVNEVAKRIVRKTVKTLAFVLVNAAVDTLTNYLQSLCESIASDILSNIKQKVDSHNISSSLKTAYETMGDESAREMLNNLTKSAFNEKNDLEKYLTITAHIGSSVLQGLAKFSEIIKKKQAIQVIR